MCVGAIGPCLGEFVTEDAAQKLFAAAQLLAMGDQMMSMLEPLMGMAMGGGGGDCQMQ